MRAVLRMFKVLAAAMLLATTAYAAGADSVSESVDWSAKWEKRFETPRLQGQLNINTATVEELTMLPGIDEETARNIVNFRNVNGPYDRVDNLRTVKGVTSHKIETVRSNLSVGGMSDLRIKERRPHIKIRTVY